MLETQAHTVTITVKLEDFNVNLLTDFNDFRRMLDAFPRHIGNVQQAVNTTQINEGTVVSKIFNHTFNRHTLLQILKQGLTLGAVRFFHNRTTRYHDVVALLVQLNNFEFQFFAFKVQGFANRTDINQRAGQERTD